MDLVTIFHTSPSPVLLRHGPLTFSSFLSLPLPRLLYIYLSFLVFQSRGQGRSKIPRFRVLYSCLRMPKSRRRTQSFFFLLIFAILSFPPPPSFSFSFSCLSIPPTASLHNQPSQRLCCKCIRWLRVLRVDRSSSAVSPGIFWATLAILASTPPASAPLASFPGAPSSGISHLQRGALLRTLPSTRARLNFFGNLPQCLILSLRPFIFLLLFFYPVPPLSVFLSLALLEHVFP